MLAGLDAVVADATAALEAADWTAALERVERFFWSFCDDYLELVKDRAYRPAGEPAGASARAALRAALDVQVRLLAPYLPYACEEVWSWWRDGSVHLAPWPAPAPAAAGADRRPLEAASQVIAAVRRAKSQARLPLRTPVALAEVTGPRAWLDAVRAAEADLAAAGRVAAFGYRERPDARRARRAGRAGRGRGGHHVSEQPREVEGVLLVRADDQEAAGRRVAALEAVDRFDLRPRPPQRIRDVYVDTGDGALAGARVAFRVRELDGRPLLTLKAGAGPVRAGRRAPGAGGALVGRGPPDRPGGAAPPPAPGSEGSGDPGGGPVGAGEPLADLAGLGLRPTQRRETTRTPRDVLERGDPDAGPVAELTIDDVAYQLPAGTARLLEVEVEAKGAGGLETVQALLGGAGRGPPRRPAALAVRQAGHRPGGGAAAGRGPAGGPARPDGRIRPAAHDRLAEFLAQNSP